MIFRWLALAVVLLAGTTNAREPIGVEIVQHGLFRSGMTLPGDRLALLVSNAVELLGTSVSEATEPTCFQLSS